MQPLLKQVVALAAMLFAGASFVSLLTALLAKNIAHLTFIQTYSITLGSWGPSRVVASRMRVHTSPCHEIKNM